MKSVQSLGTLGKKMKVRMRRHTGAKLWRGLTCFAKEF